MRPLNFLLFFAFIMMLPTSNVIAQEVIITPSSQVLIVSPTPGQALQGTILIIAEIDLDAAADVELTFSYSNNPHDTWFLIEKSNSADQQRLSFEWDTTTISDGEYTLKLVVETEDGQHIAFVPGLRVRNYSAIETNTPEPSSTPALLDTLAPSATSTRTVTPVPPTATTLPPNPAQIDTSDIGLSITRGAIITLSLFATFGVYQFFRSRRRKEK